MWSYVFKQYRRKTAERRVISSAGVAGPLAGIVSAAREGSDLLPNRETSYTPTTVAD